MPRTPPAKTKLAAGRASSMRRARIKGDTTP